jgi:hypothetical protein
LQLPEEITVLSISSSFLPPILLYRLYVELKKRHVRDIEKK